MKCDVHGVEGCKSNGCQIWRRQMTAKECEHELWEMETACAMDGLCPICLKTKLEQAEAKLTKLCEAVDHLKHMADFSIVSKDKALKELYRTRDEVGKEAT